MSVRIFIGSPVQDFNGTIRETCKQVLLKAPRWRMIVPESWHITCVFPGNIDPATLPAIISETGKLAQEIEAFDLPPEKFLFMPARKPSMLWLKMQGSKAFENLFEAFHSTLRITPSHPPNPHVTIMRGNPAKLTSHELRDEDPAHLAQRLDRINVYQSILKPGGSEYRVLESFEMKKPPR